ncbi:MULTISPECIES: RidA family protein [unclassified Chelatococcus]|uniref:RidA family protein n=1 Tax=unclassified Chelatococcus TaxID=2638111 RepID=UPI001BD06DF4|nr:MULTISPECIES: RidA family protein [unclassified Chelatococcus]MBS7700388.1 RidA family protein [Chelatococcus sp. YT9]MBX3556184.1 RidA family protein [Chelatococcus sp.]
MDIERIDSTGRLSKAVKANGFVFLSGLTASDKSGGVTEQTLDILAQIDGYLAKAGSSKSKLVKVNIWLADIKDFDAMNKAWESWADRDHLPARATVESKLAGQGSLVEMMAEGLA